METEFVQVATSVMDKNKANKFEQTQLLLPGGDCKDVETSLSQQIDRNVDY